MIFQPRRILDEKTVVRLVRFLDREEDRARAPFNRFTDTSKLDALDLGDRFIYRIALHRRRFYAGRPPVKSAFYVTSPAAARYVEIHATVNERFPLKVKMFSELDEVADWLGVPRHDLER